MELLLLLRFAIKNNHFQKDNIFYMEEICQELDNIELKFRHLTKASQFKPSLALFYHEPGTEKILFDEDRKILVQIVFYYNKNNFYYNKNNNILYNLKFYYKNNFTIIH